MHFYGWEKGLKTGMYYLRTKAAADAIQFTVDAEKLDKDKASALEEEATMKKSADEYLAELTCSLDNREACEMCSG